MVNETKIKIFIADDHQIIIDGISLLLKHEPGFEVIGSADNGAKAYERIILLKPDIAILDIKMPKLSGLEILKKLTEQKSAVKVVLLTMHKNNSYIQEAIKAGAYSYLFKNVSQEDLVKTLQLVHGGMKVFTELQEESNLANSKPFFSKREKEIFNLVLTGLTSKQISEKLIISQFTVNSHRKNINRKTQCNTLQQLQKWVETNKIS